MVVEKGGGKSGGPGRCGAARRAGPSLSLLVLGILTPAWPAATAQEVRPLGAPSARAVEGFTHVYDVAEFPDGRVLLTDSRERSLAVVDFRSATVERIGRRGAGPREFQSVFSILPRPDGSLAVYDAGQRRLLVVSPSGEVVGTERFAAPPVSGFSAPRGPDLDGQWYIDSRTVGPDGLDRAAVLYRWDPSSGAIDSLGALMQYAPGQEGPGVVPMPLGDAWSVGRDGAVARVVGEEYRVEWWLRDGRTVTGPAIPHRRVRVGRPERESWIEELLVGPLAGMSVQGGGADSRPSPAAVAERLREFDPGRFPSHVPPFRWGYAPGSPQGHVWIRLDVESDRSRTVFDVIGRDGRLVHRLAVDGRARVVGFGEEWVYLVRLDELDLEWLERYPYPSGGRHGRDPDG